MSSDILELSKEYDFEDEKVSKLDFSGLDDIGYDEIIRASDSVTKDGRMTAVEEFDVQYCIYLAAPASGMPHEFFDILCPRDIVRVRNKVRNFLISKEGVSDDLKEFSLTQEYTFDGKKVKKLDLSGVGSITLNDMCAAADALTVSGRVAINPESDVQYCLFIASRVTGISFEHLAELKTRDIMRIKTAIKRTFYGRE